MTSFKTLGLILAAAVSIAAPAVQAQEAFGDLTVTFPALKAKQGQVMIAVFDSAQGWASGKPARVAMASAADAAPSANVVSLPPGTYAIRAFQDVDGDGKMGTNPFGMPVEPYGFSNNAKVNMGPPSFDASAFTVKAGQNTHAMSLN